MQNEAQDMNTGNSGSASTCKSIDFQSIVTRAKNVLFNPVGVWSSIKNEPGTIKDIYINYAIIMAAIPAICSTIGMSVIGVFGFRIGFFAALINNLVSLGVSLASLYVAAVIIQFLASKFSGSATMVDAFKLITYSMTAAWISGFLALIPALSILGFLFAIYGLYTYYQGITPMVAVPQEKRLPFFAVTIVAIFASMIVLGLVGGIATFSTVAPSNFVNTQDYQGGSNTLDMDKVNGGLKELEKLIPGKLGSK